MKPLTTIVLSSVLAITLSSCGQDMTPAEHITKAKGYIESGELQSAKIELYNAAKNFPNDGAVRYELAKLALVQGDYPAAEKEIKLARAADFSGSATQPVLVAALFGQRSDDEVIAKGEVLDEGLSDSERALVMALVGQSLISQMEYDDSRILIETALELEPQSVEAMIGLSRLASLEGDIETARSWAEKAVEADRDAARPWVFLGDLEALAGDREAAYAAYSEAMTLPDHAANVVVKRAYQSIKLGKNAEARSDIAMLRGSSLSDQWFVDHLEGLLAFNEGHDEEAVSSLRSALGKNPRSAESMMYAAIALNRLGNYDEALILANQYAALLPASLEGKGLRGRILLNLGDISEAKAVLIELAEQEPENTEVLRLLGMAYLSEGDIQEAQRNADKLRALAPNSEDAQGLFMLSNLMAGEDLLAIEPLEGEPEGSYSHRVWQAISEFKLGRHLSARAMAEALREENPEDLDPQRIIAATYLATGDWSRGREELNAVLAMSENDQEALTNLARLEAINGNGDEVDRIARLLVSVYPKDPGVLEFASDMQGLLGNDELARQILKDGIQAIPDDAGLKLVLLRHYYHELDFDAVTDLVRNTPQLQIEKMPEILEVAGLSYARQGNLELALESFEEVIQLSPDSSQAWLNYGSILFKAGDSKRAKAAYAKALELSPDDLGVSVAFVTFAAQSGDLATADSALEQAVATHGELPALLALEGWLALLQQDFPLAQEKLSKSLEQKASAENMILLARALAYQENYVDSVKVLDDWLATHPKDLQVLLNRAGILLASSDEAAAAEAYARVLEYYPDHIAALNNTAWLSRNRDIKFARQMAERAYALDSNDPSVLDTLGNIKLLAGQADEAAQLLARASEIAPGDMQIKLHYAKALLAREDIAAAREVLQAVVAGAPGSAEALEASTVMKGI